MHTYIHTHTYTHTYHTIPYHTYYTYIQTCMHTYRHTYITIDYHRLPYITIHTYKHTYIHEYIHTYIHTYIQTYIHPSIHTYAYIQTLHYCTLHYIKLHYMHACIRTLYTCKTKHNIAQPDITKHNITLHIYIYIGAICFL